MLNFPRVMLFRGVSHGKLRHSSSTSAAGTSQLEPILSFVVFMAHFNALRVQILGNPSVISQTVLRR